MAAVCCLHRTGEFRNLGSTRRISSFYKPADCITEALLAHRSLACLQWNGGRAFVNISALWTLIPGKGGVYEFSVNGELLFSKKALSRHAEPGEIRRLLIDKIESLQHAD